MATLAETSRTGSLPRFAPALLICIAAAAIGALAQSFLTPIDCDVSWLITVNEKMLAGARIYTDVIEVNPPASIWLYTPAVWIAELLHLHAEAVVAGTFIGAGLLSCVSTLRISERLRQPPNATVLIAAVAFTALVLPLGTFAQREHAALLLAFPSLAALAVISEGRALSLISRLTTGVAAGLVIAIKPHLLLAIVPAALFACYRGRALRAIIPGALAGFAVLAIYATAVALVTPEYLKLLPILSEVYLPLREPWTAILQNPVLTIPLAICAIVFALRPGRMPALPAMFLIGSVGFAAAGIIQGKGWLNHALPGMALGFVGLTLLIVDVSMARARRALFLAATTTLAATQLYAMASIRPVPGLAQAVARVAPPRPSVITLGPDLLTGHPLVRNVGGRWAGSRAALFIADGAHDELANARGETRSKLFRWYQADIDAFANDVERERPDVVLVDSRPQLAWLRDDPRVRRTRLNYRPAARAGAIEVWTRRDR